MIKAVLDTNVILSALFWRDAPYLILKKAIKGDFLFLTSPDILKEVKEKLIFKFKVPQEKVREYLEALIVNSKIVIPQKRLKIVKADPNDNKIIECAFEGKADFIISGDTHLKSLRHYKNIKIISPKQALKIFQKP